MAGYSGTPLGKKLGLKPEMKAAFLDAPESLWPELGPLPESILLSLADAPTGLDYVHGFFMQTQALEEMFPRMKAAIHKQGIIWISWPKKAAKLPTDLDENVVRDIGLRIGIVDVKVCAVDEIWSGLKFVYRTVDR